MTVPTILWIISWNRAFSALQVTNYCEILLILNAEIKKKYFWHLTPDISLIMLSVWMFRKFLSTFGIYRCKYKRLVVSLNWHLSQFSVARQTSYFLYFFLHTYEVNKVSNELAWMIYNVSFFIFDLIHIVWTCSLLVELKMFTKNEEIVKK